MTRQVPKGRKTVFGVAVLISAVVSKIIKRGVNETTVRVCATTPETPRVTSPPGESKSRLSPALTVDDLDDPTAGGTVAAAEREIFLLLELRQ